MTGGEWRERTRHLPLATRHSPLPGRGVEPRPAASKTAVPPSHPPGVSRRTSIPTWIRTRAATFGESHALRYTIGTTASSKRRADDWIRTSMCRFTRAVPVSVRATSAKGARGESNPPPRPSQGRMQNHYTTSTMRRPPIAAAESSISSGPTRSRTRNPSLEARDDFRFTIEPRAEGAGVEPASP